MKIKLTAYFLLASLIFILSSISNNSFTNTAGPPAGYTGSPFDGKTCGIGGCHSITPLAKTGWITSTVPGTGYVPGITYTITAKVINPLRSKFGFEVSPQSLSGTLLGTIIITNSTETKFATTKYITQTAAGCGGSGSRTWTFNWKAPLTGTGNVTFYGAFNATNANGSSSGDSIYTSTLLINEDPNISVNNLSAEDKRVTVFPNPTHGLLNVEFSTEPIITPLTVTIYDLNGQIVKERAFSGISGAFDLSENPSGMYFVVIGTTYGRLVKKILKE